jgi:hypothetical protein
VFKFFLVDENGQVGDPAGFVTAVPNWTLGETFLLGRGEKFRILEIRTDLLPEMLGRSQGAQQRPAADRMSRSPQEARLIPGSTIYDDISRVATRHQAMS